MRAYYHSMVAASSSTALKLALSLSDGLASGGRSCNPKAG